MSSAHSSIGRTIAKHVAFAAIALGVGLTVGLAKAWPFLMQQQSDGVNNGPCLCEYREINGEKIGNTLNGILSYRVFGVTFSCWGKAYNAGPHGVTQYTERFRQEVEIKKAIDWPQCRKPEIFACYQRAQSYAGIAAVLVFAALLALSKSRRKRNSQE